MIPYSTQTIDEDDVKAVCEALKSPLITCGDLVPQFEDEVCAYTKAPFAVAVNSCTSALHLAMLALGIGEGDKVYVSAISFVASANCARYVGANVEFVDVDKDTGNLDLDCLESMLCKDEKNHSLPKALVAVHLSGRPLDLDRLYALKERFNFKLIEDAAHALGAIYKGHRIGSCEISEITVLSFHLAKKVRKLSSHGIEHNKELLFNKYEPMFYYEMQELGFNYRLTELQAALGISQLNKIEEFLRLRRKQAQEYKKLFANENNIGLPLADNEDNISSWHLYQVRVENRDEIYSNMRKRGIGVQVHYLPIYSHPYYQNTGNYPKLKGAEDFFAHTLSIPLYPKLNLVNQQLVAATLCSLVDKL